METDENGQSRKEETMMKVRKISKRLLAVAIVLTIALSAGATASAKIVEFKHFGTVYHDTFESSDQTNWVGQGCQNKSRKVSIIQAANNTLFTQIAVDGIWGQDTAKAIEKFQVRYGFSQVDRICGTNTWNSIYGEFGKHVWTQGLQFIW